MKLKRSETVKAETDPSKLCIWLFGPPFAGKTTFAHDFAGDGNPETLGSGSAESTVLIACEPGHKYLDWKTVVTANTWKDFKETVLEIKEKADALKEEGIKNVCIDTLDGLFSHCIHHMRNKKGVDFHAEDFGKSSNKVTMEFLVGVNTLANLGLGTILVSHETQRTVFLKNKSTTKTVPDLPGKARQHIGQLCDLVCQVIVEEDSERRVLIDARSDVESGMRIRRELFTEEELENGFPLNGNKVRSILESKLGETNE